MDKGHEKVLLGFELLKQYKKDISIFDTWLKDFEKTLDGRGRMGSLVGAHEDLKKLGIYNAPDKHLMEYAVKKINHSFNLIYIYIYIHIHIWLFIYFLNLKLRFLI